MTDRVLFEKLLFERIAREEESAGGEGEFNTVNEKRLHRVLKRFILQSELEGGTNENALHTGGYEQRVGRYVADVLLDGKVFEIQTGSTKPLAAKLRYYLENTDYHVTLCIPVKRQTLVLRVDRDSGELISGRRSPKKESVLTRLEKLVYIGELLREERLTVRFIELTAAEQRYSERVRGRKSGAYDAELFPRELVAVSEYSRPEDYLGLIPESLRERGSFYAADLSSLTKISGRRLSNTLNFFCGIGILTRESEGRKYLYRVVG